MTAPARPTSYIEHELKTWPEFFTHLLTGEKTFELRKDDRGFRVGHILRLREWSPKTQTYSGRELRYRVTYVLSGVGLEPNMVVMGIAAVQPTPPATLVERQFPIQGSKRFTGIPWSLIQPHWRQAEKNHDQSLDRLAYRGGLSTAEAVAVLKGLHWSEVRQMTDAEAEDALAALQPPPPADGSPRGGHE